jgi:hypothetical protein
MERAKAGYTGQAAPLIIIRYNPVLYLYFSDVRQKLTPLLQFLIKKGAIMMTNEN